MFKLLLFLLTTPTWAAVTHPSTNEWHVANTGDPAADGKTLRDFLVGTTDVSVHNAPLAYACGDTIGVEPGTYLTLDLGSGYGSWHFDLPAQAGCSGPSQKTKIIVCSAANIGNCAASLALVPSRPAISDLPNMFVLKAVRSPYAGGSVLSNYSTVPNNFSLLGMGVTSDSDISAIDHNFIADALVKIANETISINPAVYPHDIEIGYSLIVQGEEITYGSIIHNPNPNAYFRGVKAAVVLGGKGFNIHDSTMIADGFDPTSPVTATITSCTSVSATTQCSATGLAAALGIGTTGNCTSGATKLCYDSGGAVFAALSGAPSGWAGTGRADTLDGLHGLKFLYYIDANTVGVDSSYRENFWWPVHLNSSTFGTFSGTVTARVGLRRNFDPVYAFDSGYFEDSLLENNLISGGWPAFISGGAYATAYGDVQAGSDSTHIILSNIQGRAPVIGDLISVAVDYRTYGRSSYCSHPTGFTCSDATYRVGKVTGVSGSTYTVVPHGPDGIDVPPLTGTNCEIRSTNGVTIIADTGGNCTSMWDGKHSIENSAILRNTINTSWWSFIYGKQAFELKDAKNALVDGNIFTDSISSTTFIDAVAQSSGGITTGLNTVWSTSENFHVSNNLWGGDHGAGLGSAIRDEYNESTTQRGTNSWFVNNIGPETISASNAASFLMHFSGSSGGFAHNTITRSPNSIYFWYWMFDLGSCAPAVPFFAPYGGIPASYRFRDNLISFGVGPLSPTTDCWESGNPASQIDHNLFVADTGTFSGMDLINNPATITTALPGNSAAIPADVGLTGSCTFANYMNCGLAPSSTFKGTASDGGDQGADVLQVRDHLNNWSRAAGLISYNLSRTTGGSESQWIINPSRWTVGATTSSASFDIVNAIGSCNVHLYTNRARTTEHADTASGNSACNRAGSTVSGSNVTFAFGGHAALTEGNTYYPVVTDGSRVMTAVPFTTTGEIIPPASGTSVTGVVSITGVVMR